VKNLSAVFKALSDETRLAMLALLLRHDELCVCDFVEVLRITQSKASRHLRYLHGAGLLQDRRDTQWVHYRIHEEPDEEAQQVLAAVAPLLDAQPLKELEQRLASWMAQKKRKASGCAGGDGRVDAAAPACSTRQRGASVPARPRAKSRASARKEATR